MGAETETNAYENIQYEDISVEEHGHIPDESKRA